MSDKNSEKRKALEAAMGQIEKQFGKGSIMKLGNATNLPFFSNESVVTHLPAPHCILQPLMPRLWY